MAVRRIYTFHPANGLALQRAEPGKIEEEDRLLNPLKLTNGQLAILFIVDLLSAATPTDIAYALVMDATTIRANVDTLRKLQVIETIKHATVARADAIKLTTLGQLLLDTGLDLWRAAHARPAASGAEELDAEQAKASSFESIR